MLDKIHSTKEYTEWFKEIKDRILINRQKAILTVNKELILFYWSLGESIVRKQEESKWGNKIIDVLSKDLTSVFPDSKGFSRRNLYYVKKFYLKFSNFHLSDEIVPQLGAQFGSTLNNKTHNSDIPEIINYISTNLPWGHVKLIIDKITSSDEIMFYIKQIINNGWSRNALALQIKSDLFSRQGQAITNFSETLPTPQSEMAQQLIKDPYTLDFLDLTPPFKEKDIENQLIDHITKFLLELGKGFAFIGQQYHIEVGGNDYYIDLLFYHITLHCYVVIELKNSGFTPEHAGKLNFYLSAVDSLLKSDKDNPTIGILLCRDKNRIVTEFSLRGMNKPMSVGEFNFTQKLPEELRSSLPTSEEIESDLYPD